MMLHKWGTLHSKNAHPPTGLAGEHRSNSTQHLASLTKPIHFCYVEKVSEWMTGSEVGGKHSVRFLTGRVVVDVSLCLLCRAWPTHQILHSRNKVNNGDRFLSQRILLSGRKTERNVSFLQLASLTPTLTSSDTIDPWCKSVNFLSSGSFSCSVAFLTTDATVSLRFTCIDSFCLPNCTDSATSSTWAVAITVQSDPALFSANNYLSHSPGAQRREARAGLKAWPHTWFAHNNNNNSIDTPIFLTGKRDLTPVNSVTRSIVSCRERCLISSFASYCASFSWKGQLHSQHTLLCSSA